MSMRHKYTVAMRQGIIEDFARRHNGQYDAALFFKEVRERGRQHPAFDWFTWNRTEAAYQHNLWQARAFAQGVKVSFTVENVGNGGTFVMDAPLVISPLSGRQGGGGYVTLDPANEEHVAELSRQAASALRSWMARYGFCVQHAGLTMGALEQIAQALEGAASPSQAA